MPWLRWPFERVETGSSVIQGKVNSAIPDVVNQVAFYVVGNNLTITKAAEAGQLQLNAVQPIIARARASAHRRGGVCRRLPAQEKYEWQ